MNVADEFLFLEADETLPGEGGLKIRQLEMDVGEGHACLGIDMTRRRHLLIPAGDQPVTPDARSRGVVLVERVLQSKAGEELRFADLECREPGLALVFERLVEDVLARMASGRPQGLAAIHVTLDEWRELLRTAGTPLDRDTILGLIGELEILRRIGESDPTAALRAWKGPRRTVHDFVIKGHALEVKSTAAIDGNTVSVSNIDQLDPSETDELHLVVVHCKESDQAPGLDDRIRELLNLGFPRGQLLDAVADAGYVFESSVAGMPRFAVRSVRVWSIDADFPGLRRGDIPEERRRGVSRIRYDLALDSAAPRLKDAEASKLLGEWLSHDD